jgi:hypothetical protein
MRGDDASMTPGKNKVPFGWSWRSGDMRRVVPV